MQKSRAPDGRRNLCSRKVMMLRMQMQPKCSQRALADKLQLLGVDITKNSVQRIESGERSVTDIELKALAEIFHVSVDELLTEE